MPQSQGGREPTSAVTREEGPGGSAVSGNKTGSLRPRAEMGATLPAAGTQGLQGPQVPEPTGLLRPGGAVRATWGGAGWCGDRREPQGLCLGWDGKDTGPCAHTGARAEGCSA